MTIETPPGGTYGARMPAGRMLRTGALMMSAIYRLFGGRGVSNLLLLTTVGAHSGEKRTTPVRRFDDGEGRWLVVAMAGGQARQPAWLHNLAVHPDQVWVEIGRQRTRVRPDVLVGDARDETWKRIVTEAPEFGVQEAKTDRQVPVVRLTREA